MSSVDDRIVNMQFNNKQFTQGASDSKKALEDLEGSLAKTGNADGLAKMGASVDGVANKFSLMKVAGISAIATIASKATLAGIDMLKSLTLDPILGGFHEYETNLNSIQTIMANTGKKVGVVNSYLEELNHYSDQTIYNFSQMADAIGKFTSAGVNLKDATSSIKGMANTAALSGSNVQQLNTAMYQMSQALSTGTIRLMDWNSLANAGMGGKNIREALMATNRTLGDHGALMDSSIKQYGSFRDSLTSGWLSAETFNKTMKVMAGTTNKAGKTVAYTVEQLKGMGYSKDAAAQLHTLSKASIESATKIKTFSQLIDVVKESIGSGWAKIFQDLFGNFKEATKLWTGVGTKITDGVGKIFGSVDAVLLQWKKLGGYADLWTGIGNIFQTLGNLISPFVDAFKTLLPTAGNAGSALAGASSGFERITNAIEVASRGAKVITPVLVAIFGAFKQGGAIVGSFINQLAPLLPLLSGLAKKAENLAAQGASIAQGLIGGLLEGLNVGNIEQAVVNFANSIVDWIKGALGIHSPATELIPVGINIVKGIASGIINAEIVVFKALGDLMKKAIEGFGGLFKGFSALDWTSLFNGILTGSLLLMTRKVIQFVDTWKGFGNNMQDIFTGLGDSMKSWQNSLKAKMILDIAIAIGILAASIIALSFVDPKKLAIGLGAITTMMGILSGTLLALSKIDSDKQMAVLAASLLLISFAMLQFTGAVILLGSQDISTLSKGLGAMAGVLALLIGAMFGFSKIKGSVEGMAGSLFVISMAMNLLAAAVLALGSMNMETLGKGLGAIAAGLALFVGAMLAMDRMKGSPEGLAGSILIMSAAMVVLSVAVATFGNMDMGTLAKGFAAVALGLGIMVGALLLLSGNSAGVMAAAGAMVLMATAMNLLVGVILTLGLAPWSVVGKGLLVVAAALAIFLLAGLAAMYVGPGLLVLGQSVLLFGAGMALAGIGMALFATGLATLALVGTAATGVIIAAIHAFLALLPEIARQLASAFVAFIKVIANASDEIRPAFNKIFKNMIGIIIDNIPIIGKLFTKLIKTGLKVIRQTVPDFIETGLLIIDKFLEGLARHLPNIIKSGTDIIVALIKGIGNAYPRIIDEAAKTIIKFVRGLSTAIDNNAGEMRSAGLELAMAIVNGLTGGLLGKGVEMLKSAVIALADKLPWWLKKFLHINSPSKVMIPIGEFVGAGVAKGITNSLKEVLQSLSDMADQIVAAGNSAVLKAAQAATKAQKKAYELQARADLAAKKAQEAAQYAHAHKSDKAAQKRAKELQKQAQKQQALANAAQQVADRASQHVEDVRAFENADLHGKGDIKDAEAVALADKAAKMLAKANAEAARARELMKTNVKAGRAMLAQARRDATSAQDLENRARAAHADAQKYYAQEVNDRIKQMEDADAAAKKAAEDQAAYDAADAQGKSDILKARAEADQARADAAKAKMLELLAQAKELAATDAITAMLLLDQADAAAKEAQEAADKAKQELDQASQVLSQGGSSTTGGTSVIAGRSILEDAASAIDRYTASLQEASDLAATQPGVIQFVQNNHSPESLSAAEIYRQSKNLLSAAEIKMGP